MTDMLDARKLTAILGHTWPAYGPYPVAPYPDTLPDPALLLPLDGDPDGYVSWLPVTATGTAVRWEAATVAIPTVGDISRPLGLQANRIVAMGDSITAGGTDNSLGRLTGYTTWFTYACMYSGQRLVMLRNSGIGGNTSAQMLARFDTDVIDHDPAIVTILAGTNDSVLATTQANITAMIALAQTAGIAVVLLTIPPQDAADATKQSTFIDPLNAWIMAYPGILASIDVNTPVNDGADKWAAGLTSDGVHPTEAGARLMGQTVADALTALLPDVQPPFVTTADTSESLITNPCFVGDANADGLADSWINAGGTGTATFSLVAGTGEVTGNWQRMTNATTGTRSIRSAAVSTGFAAGDRMAFYCRVRASGWVAADARWTPSIIFTGGSLASITPAYNVITDTTGDDMAVYGEFEVPASVTAMASEFAMAASASGSSRYLDVAEVTLVNLTALATHYATHTASVARLEEGTTNYCINPVPSGTTGWVGSGGLSVSQSAGWLKAVRPATASGAVLTATGTSASPATTTGEVWTISMTVRKQAGGAWTANLRGQFFNAANGTGSQVGSTFQASQVAPTSDAAGQRITYTLPAAPSGAVSFRPSLLLGGGTLTAGDEIWIKDVQWERKSHATTFCAGTEPDCTWTGTPHASSSTRPDSDLTVTTDEPATVMAQVSDDGEAWTIATIAPGDALGSDGETAYSAGDLVIETTTGVLYLTNLAAFAGELTDDQHESVERAMAHETLRPWHFGVTT